MIVYFYLNIAVKVIIKIILFLIIKYLFNLRFVIVMINILL